MEHNQFIRSVALKRDAVQSFDQYPFTLPAVRHLDELQFRGPVTFFVGENGSGKSTILESIAVAAGLNAEGGSRNFRFTTRATHSNLSDYVRLVRAPRRPRDSYFLRAETFYNVASAAEDYGRETAESHGGGRSPHEQSHGESFMALVLHRLGGNGLYLFDEPEAALSPTRQLALLAAMHRLVASGSQFIVATHSPILMAYPGALIYEFYEKGVRPVAYTETEHYVVTRAFLGNPERMLRNLLDEEPDTSG